MTKSLTNTERPFLTAFYRVTQAKRVIKDAQYAVDGVCVCVWYAVFTNYDERSTLKTQQIARASKYARVHH